MKWLKRMLGLFLVLIVGVIIAALIVINPFGASPFNRYTRSGSLDVPGLKAPVTVHRDEKGMAYIYADNMEDLYLAQGFVTAQDRLFQMELTRLFASGRISELAGEKEKDLDIRMRTLGFHRNAARHVQLLDERTRKFLQKYIDGVNAYIETRQQNIHLEFKLAGIQPAKWSIADSLTILYYLGWNSAGNIEAEIIALMLVEKLGPNKAAEIFPININPDDEPGAGANLQKPAPAAANLGAALDKTLLSYLDTGSLRLGSNNWVVDASLSPGGKPVLANDPHLEATLLPGPWYPCGLITPQFRAVGVTIPGTGGMVIGRTEHIAMGVTNAYGDTQDLYVETLDPDNPGHYLEGDRSIPFEVIEETLKIKDKSAADGYRTEKINIRLTRRGPVISGIMPGLQTDKVISMRWSSFEAMAPSVGFERLIESRTISEVRQALKDVNQIALNYVFTDSSGNIGWSVTGKLPIRTQGEALVPYVVQNSQDNWTGWVPWQEMPHTINPARGWIGTCNHLTVKRDYPYYYASSIAPSYRYRRLIELMDSPEKKSVEDHWAFQRDTLNPMAQKIAPLMARALSAHTDTEKLGQILAGWDFSDDPDSAAATIFQAVYREFALLVFTDELGEDLAKKMLDVWYFWQERLEHKVLDSTSVWFDDIKTADRRETRDDLFHQAGLNAIQNLSATLGDNPDNWQWGKVHRHDFLSPIRRSGAGKDFLGGGPHPAAGSTETLYRGIYHFSRPFKVEVSASLRMVVDMADPDKILAVLPGGVSGRQFDPHTTDQVEPFMNGDILYWWFSDNAIKAHTRHTLILKPRSDA
jgi:penicillin amidase